MFLMSLTAVVANSHLSVLDLNGILCSPTCFVAGPVSNYLVKTIPGLNSTRAVESILKRIKSLTVCLFILIGETFTPFSFSDFLIH